MNSSDTTVQCPHMEYYEKKHKLELNLSGNPTGRSPPFMGKTLRYKFTLELL